jgi:hypothetical protein
MIADKTIGKLKEKTQSNKLYDPIKGKDRVLGNTYNIK